MKSVKLETLLARRQQTTALYCTLMVHPTLAHKSYSRNHMSPLVVLMVSFTRACRPPNNALSRCPTLVTYAIVPTQSYSRNRTHAIVLPQRIALSRKARIDCFVLAHKDSSQQTHTLLGDIVRTPRIALSAHSVLRTGIVLPQRSHCALLAPPHAQPSPLLLLHYVRILPVSGLWCVLVTDRASPRAPQANLRLTVAAIAMVHHALHN